MCGIAGILTNNRTFDGSFAIEQMLSKISHRGPDGAGVWTSKSQRNVLGHKRLSIIDLNANASQPMQISEGYVIVFNGEIYNHKELRTELESHNVVFRTKHSDTEVLLNGFIFWGIDKLLVKLNGMFTFAVYDEIKNNVVICRDRVGIKNVYYSVYSNKFIFCSEIKGILAADYFKPEFDNSNLNEYLLNRSIAAPNTLFKNICKLEPATYLTVNLDSLDYEKTQYWDPLTITENKSITSQEDVERELVRLIDSSLEYRLEADVPVGMFLSGGVDSNYLLSRLSKKRQGIKCFNASFDANKSYDESSDAKRMAEKFGAEFIDVPVDEGSYLDVLEEVVYFQEEPIAAPVCVPVFFLSKAAKKAKVPVILAGEGSDEVFIGYTNWLKIRKAQKLYRRLPFAKQFSRAAKTIARRCVNFTHPMHDILDRASKGLPLFWGGAMDINYLTRKVLLEGTNLDFDSSESLYKKSIEHPYTKHLHNRPASNDSSWMAYMDLQQRLPELMLPRLDRMGMAHSIEGRVPYLDHRIIEFVFSVPEKVMMENSNIGKSALKVIAARTLGREFVFRKKKGFQAPVSDWKDGVFGTWVEYLRLFSQRTNIFNVDGIDILVKHGGRRYFTLVNFMIWYLVYIDNVLLDKLPQLKRWDEY
ncbi:MAG: hypothetical protein AXW17_13145 [Colwellia sp. Phe_37]|nr:MAG: hypothetical protein AXW17_13145 [Colwellia sp. Phe_37]